MTRQSVKIPVKQLSKVGSSYGAIIPKIYIEGKMLDPKKRYIVSFEEMPLFLRLVRALDNSINNICRGLRVTRPLFHLINNKRCLVS